MLGVDRRSLCVLLLIVSAYAVAWGLGYLTADMSRFVTVHGDGVSTTYNPGPLPQLPPTIDPDLVGQGLFAFAVVAGCAGLVLAAFVARPRQVDPPTSSV
jgi:hypothetical protein